MIMTIMFQPLQILWELIDWLVRYAHSILLGSINIVIVLLFVNRV